MAPNVPNEIDIFIQPHSRMKELVNNFTNKVLLSSNYSPAYCLLFSFDYFLSFTISFILYIYIYIYIFMYVYILLLKISYRFILDSQNSFKSINKKMINNCGDS